MKRSAVKVWCVLLLSVSTSLSAADRVRITVIPLNYINVSKADASSMTRLLETGIVKTDSFTVIEQTQVGVLLSAQEYSLQECTDETCAIRIGKLLAAEQIVLGDVSRIGAKLVITAKIIDVETGMTLKADKVEASNIEGLADETELLAFKLAGLTYQRGTQEVIARSFGELFVQTSPEDAEVIVNGISRGQSPLLVPRVPVGTVIVEGRKSTLYASQTVELTGIGLTEVDLALTVRLGRFFVKSSEKSVEVFLDGKGLGPLGSGLFKDVPIGDHRLELRGSDMYWQGSVRVADASTVIVDAVPTAVGVLEYQIPDGARAELTGNGIRLILSGSGRTENMAVGTYDVQVSGELYRVFTTKLGVTKGRISLLAPQPMMERSEQYQAAVIEEERALALHMARQYLWWIEQLAEVTPLFFSDVQAARQWLGSMETLPYRFENEEGRAREYVAAIERKVARYDLTERRDALVNQRDRSRSKHRAGRTTGWLTLATGLAAAGGFVTSYILGEAGYDVSPRFYNAFGYLAGAMAVISPISFLSAGRIDEKVEEEIRDLDRRIEALSP